MSGRYLLDTNIVIALFAGDPAVKNRLGEAREVFVPSIVVGELYYGARKSRRVDENTARIDDFVTRNVVLSCDVETARRYGEIKYALQKKGQLIPQNDTWIAAMALQNDLTIVARDAHFEAVEGLKLEAWR